MNESKKLQQNKRIEQDNIIYLLNEEEKTASIVKCNSKNDEIIIPQTIKIQQNKYYVTEILERAFDHSGNKSILFPADSKLQRIGKEAFYCSYIQSITIPSKVTKIEEGCFYSCNYLHFIEIPKESMLQTIEKNAFFYTEIERFTIPSKLIELKDGWQFGSMNLKSVNVSPFNSNFIEYNKNEMIFGKSSPKMSNFDLLVFCSREVKFVEIPNFIERIYSYVFYSYQSLQSIEIQSNSKLQSIGKCSFSESCIKRIKIPSNVTKIEEQAFAYCEKLQKIDFEKNSKLKTIGKKTFYYSSIKSISIPSEVTVIEEDVFKMCEYLQIVEFVDDSKLDKIDINIFSQSGKTIVMLSCRFKINQKGGNNCIKKNFLNQKVPIRPKGFRRK